MISVSKWINEVTINGREYLLNDDGRVMLFPDVESAKTFLIAHDISEEFFGEDIWFENEYENELEEHAEHSFKKNNAGTACDERIEEA